MESSRGSGKAEVCTQLSLLLSQNLDLIKFLFYRPIFSCCCGLKCVKTFAFLAYRVMTCTYGTCNYVQPHTFDVSVCRHSFYND